MADIPEYVPAKYVAKARPAGINTPGHLATCSDSGFGRKPEFETENIYSTPRDNSVFASDFPERMFSKYNYCSECFKIYIADLDC